MSDLATASPCQRFEGADPGAFVELTADEIVLRLGRRSRLRKIPLRDLTHLAVSSRGLWLATRRGIVPLLRARFREGDGPERVAEALRASISQLPDGAARLETLQRIDRLAQQPVRQITGTAVAGVCVAVAVLQLIDPFATDVGAFMPGLVARGEYWRIATGNFLHHIDALPAHLLLNLVALVLLAVLTERPLGPARTLLVMTLAGLGAMGFSAAAGYTSVIGASGVVFGLVGAALALELHFPQHLPVWWRLPRALIAAVIAWELGGMVFEPRIAAAAHVGGLLAGYGAVLGLGLRDASDGARSSGLRAMAALCVLGTALCFAAATPLVLRDGRALEAHAHRLLDTQDLPSRHLNNLAWIIATQGEPGRVRLDLAQQLAERAVRETERLDPNWLDTLAEVHFVRGERERALAVIDEAIRLAPGSAYLSEQRRRFLGERAFDDRPLPLPRLPWFRNEDDVPEPPRFETGVEV